MKFRFTLKGGPGSGHHGHAGRPGKHGGSLPGDHPSRFPKARPDGVDTMEQFTTADGRWTPERVALHDKIVASFFKGKTPVENPTSYMLGGGPAAGKSTIIKTLNLPENMVLAAGDDIKAMLPEYKHGDPSDPKRAPFVHEESSYLAKRIMAEAAAQKYNVIMDGTGDSGLRSVQAKVNALGRAGQPVRGIYVTVDTETAVARSIERARKTGRYMPEAVLRANHAAISAVFPELVKDGGFASVDLYDTSAGTAELIASSKGSDFTIHNSTAYQKFLNKATGG